MRNLTRLTNAANRLEAWRDWKSLEAEAIANGIDPAPYRPSTDAGWRKIDRAIARLRALVADTAEGEK